MGSGRGVSKVSSLRNSVSLYIYFYFFVQFQLPENGKFR